MSVHGARVEWRAQGDFASGRYSRAHAISFDGGASLAGSASPSVVPLPYSVESGVDPEELFVASIATCHMLWFLDLARRDGLMVNSYVDEAEGHMGLNTAGRQAVMQVTLRPQIGFSGDCDPARLERLHHAAHEACFIANSVTTKVVVEPR